MKILLDENLGWRLERYLPGHEVESVPLIGRAGVGNGELLERAQDRFEIFITMDSKMVRDLNIQAAKAGTVIFVSA